MYCGQVCAGRPALPGAAWLAETSRPATCDQESMSVPDIVLPVSRSVGASSPPWGPGSIPVQSRRLGCSPGATLVSPGSTRGDHGSDLAPKQEHGIRVNRLDPPGRLNRRLRGELPPPLLGRLVSVALAFVQVSSTRTVVGKREGCSWRAGSPSYASVVVGHSRFSLGNRDRPGHTVMVGRRHEPGHGPGWARLSLASLKKLCRQGMAYRCAGGWEDPPGREIGPMVA